MESIIGTIVWLFVGGIIGGGVVWLITKLTDSQKVARLEADLRVANERNDEIQQAKARLEVQSAEWQQKANDHNTEYARLQADLDAANKQLAERTDIEKTLLDQFKVLASEVIANNRDEFVKAADEKIASMVKPLSDELKRIEESRNTSQGSLKQQIEMLVKNNKNLADETRNLSTALKRPEVRGSWGEMQLRRVVELAGMTNYCDYEEQVSVTSDDGSRDRPDMVVRMPNDRTIVVDAKTPMSAYLMAVESDTDGGRQEAIQRHAQQVRERARSLAQKSYQQKFDKAPDFVVMFLPGEHLLFAALENDHDLIDWAMQQKVILATPNTLMALLKAVAMGWREVQLAENAAQIRKLGQELHDRLYTFSGHMGEIRRSLNGAVESFNKGVGSLESRVFTSARRFKELGIESSHDIPEIDEVDKQIRSLDTG